MHRRVEKLAERHRETSFRIVDVRRGWGGCYHGAGDVSTEREERGCVVTSSRLTGDVESLDCVDRLERVERGINQLDLPRSPALQMVARRAERSRPGDLNEGQARGFREAVGAGLHLARG